MRVRAADHPRSSANGGARARAAALVALAAVVSVTALLPSGAGRDPHPPQASETAAAIAARPGVEQVEPLGGKLYPPRYDTLDYQLNQLVARHEGREAAPGTPAMAGDERVAVVVLVAPARAGDVAAYLRENGVAHPAPATGADSLAAAVPIALLPGLAGRPGVQRVMVDPPVQRLGHGIKPHGADFWHDPGWDGGNGNDTDTTNDGDNVKIGILDTGFLGYGRGLRATPKYVPEPKGLHCFMRGANNTYTTTDEIAECESASFLDEHGTLVTQLAYDIAPGADYYLARIVLPSQFEAAITWFIQQGVDVISTSLGKRWEGPGDGTSPYTNTWISQVGRAVTNGIFVAVASGNSDTSSWFGKFRDNDNDNVMEWNDAGDECNLVRFPAVASFNIRVRWEDRWNGADDDLDIYLRDKPADNDDQATGTIRKMSEEAQSGQSGQDPVENIFLATGGNDRTYCLVIERASGATTDWVQVIVEGGTADVRSIEHWTRGYSLTSPAETTNPGALTVGAAPANNTTTIQDTSGRGPLPNSTVVKPDVIGVDTIPGSSPFGGMTLEGTSFAAPHVAGLAALVKQRNPTFTPAEIATYLKDNALERGDPDPNNTWGYGLAFLPHIGPVITGDPRSGIELTANTNDVDDIDGIPASPTYTYQWIRVSSDGTEANISGATSATYTPVQADVGRTLKVKVSFQDSATTPNDEEQTSVASLRVVPLASANRAATGAPTISGTLRVTETLTASTSAIRDTDGLSGVTYKYQWVRVDAGTDTDISGAEGQTYVLQEADQGKTVKVRVTFDDDFRNEEERESAETGSIGVKANIPPAFPSGEDGMREVEETRGGEAHVAQDIGAPVAATDPDGDTLTYSIKDGSDLFEIDSSGQLRTKAAVDYEIPRSHRHTIVVQVTDSKDIDGVADTVIDDTINVTITVTNVDDPPVITGPQTVDWPENAAGTITTYRASDPEGVATFLSLIDTGDDDSFDFSSGRLSFKSTELPDFEGKQQYHIELGATTDFLALAFDTTYAVTINITDVDEPPEITLASGGSEVTVDVDAVSVDENYDDPLAYVTATDPESTHTDYTLALGGTHSSSFTLSSAGEFRFTNPPDHEAREVYRLSLTASNASESSTLNVTVTVGDVNEPPNITGEAEVTVNEGHTGTLRTYQKNDPDRPSQTTNWGPVGSSEVLSGADSDAFAFDQTTGRLTFAMPPDYENGGGTYQVTLTANDGAAAGTLDVTVTVGDVDEPPEITLASAAGVDVTVDESAVSVDENHTADLVNVTATDPEGIHADYTFALGGTDSGSFTLNSTGELSFTNPPDHEARDVYRLRLTASNASESSTLNVTVTVGDVNESPVITGEAEVTVNEVEDPTPGQVVTVGSTYGKSDPDRPMQTTNWGPVGSSEVLSGADSVAFAFDLQAGRLTFASPPDFEGGGSQYQVTLTANDGTAGGNPRHHRERRQRGGDGHARAEWRRTAGRQRRAATGDADGSGRRRHRDVGVAALGGQVGPLGGHREHRRQQLYADRRRCRPLPAGERHVHGRGRYDRDHLDHGHRVPDGERRLGEPAPDAARPASPGRRHRGERRRAERRASGVHRPGGRAADLLARWLE